MNSVEWLWVMGSVVVVPCTLRWLCGIHPKSLLRTAASGSRTLGQAMLLPDPPRLRRDQPPPAGAFPHRPHKEARHVHSPLLSGATAGEGTGRRVEEED